MSVKLVVEKIFVDFNLYKLKEVKLNKCKMD